MVKKAAVSNTTDDMALKRPPNLSTTSAGRSLLQRETVCIQDVANRLKPTTASMDR